MADTVTVACKLPAGLIVTHGRTSKGDDGKLKTTSEGHVIVEDAKTYKFNGANEGADERTKNDDGRYGLTPGVDAEWVRNWIETHPNFPPIKQGLVFIEKTESSAKAHAKEVAEVKSGFEGVEQMEVQETALPDKR